MFSPTICGFTIGTKLVCTELLTIFFGPVLLTLLLAVGTLLLASGLWMTVFKVVDGGPVLVAAGGPLDVDAAVGPVLVAAGAPVFFPTGGPFFLAAVFLGNASVGTMVLAVGGAVVFPGDASVVVAANGVVVLAFGAGGAVVLGSFFLAGPFFLGAGGA